MLVDKVNASVVELSGTMTLVAGTLVPEAVEFVVDKVPEIAPADLVDVTEGPAGDEVMIVGDWELEVTKVVLLEGIGPHPGTEGSDREVEET